MMEASDSSSFIFPTNFKTNLDENV